MPSGAHPVKKTTSAGSGAGGGLFIQRVSEGFVWRAERKFPELYRWPGRCW